MLLMALMLVFCTQAHAYTPNHGRIGIYNDSNSTMTHVYVEEMYVTDPQVHEMDTHILPSQIYEVYPGFPDMEVYVRVTLSNREVWEGQLLISDPTPLGTMILIHLTDHLSFSYLEDKPKKEDEGGCAVGRENHYSIWVLLCVISLLSLNKRKLKSCTSN
jgi:hypothetical protein